MKNIFLTAALAISLCQTMANANSAIIETSNIDVLKSMASENSKIIEISNIEDLQSMTSAKFIIIKTSKTEDLKSIAGSLTNDDLYVSDCDAVLFQAEFDLPKLWMFLKKNQNANSQKYTFTEAASIVLKNPRRVPVSNEMISVFETLRQNDVPIFILTACGRGQFGVINSMEEWREKTLDQIGLLQFLKTANGDEVKEFREIAVPNTSKLIQSSSYIPAIKNNIIYTCNTPKDIVFQQVLGDKHPRKIVFVDDCRKNVDLIGNLCQKLNIGFIGVHYTAAEDQENPNKISALNQALSSLILFGDCRSLDEENALPSKTSTSFEQSYFLPQEQDTEDQSSFLKKSVSFASSVALNNQTRSTINRSSSVFDLSDEEANEDFGDQNVSTILSNYRKSIPPRCSSVDFHAQ